MKFLSSLVLSVYQGGSSGDLNSTGTISLNTWQHIAASITPNGTNANVAFYINGAAAGIGSTRRPNNLTRQLNYLGKSHWGGDAFYQDRYGIARIYNAPLTAQQIKQNCLAQEARFTSTLQSICGAP